MGGSDTLAGLGGSDDLRGDFGNRGSLYGGSAGNDTITGGTGNDGMYGEAGVDDLQARDGEADGAVNCGTDGGSATVDAEGVDAVVHSCTTVSRPTVVTDTKVDTKPKIAVAGVTVTNLTDTTARVKLPDMRGKHVFTALNMLDKAGIATKITFDTKEMSLSQLPKNIDPEKGKWQAGYILSHTPGTKMVTIGSRTELPLRILVWSGIPRLDCLDQARALTAGKSTDLAFSEFRMVLRDLGCKLDDVRIDLEKTTTQPKEIDRTSGDRCEVDKVFKSGRNTVDVELDIPQDADKQDLRVYTMHSNDGLSMVERDGKLTATYSSYAQAFRVFVGSRSAGQQMNNVTLYVHYKSNDGDYNTTLQSITGAANQADGTARFRVATPKEGTVWIAAVGIDRNGNSVCGSTFIPVVDRGTGNRSKVAPGDVLTTIGGVHWKMTPDASFKRTATATGKSVEPGAKGRLSAKGWIDSIGALWNAIFGKARPQAAAAVLSASDQAAAVKALEAESNLQLALWRVNTGIIGPAAIISGGAGNIISGGAGNIISGGAGNVTGASSVTTAGGNRAFGFQSGTGIISGGAGNFQSGAGVTDMKSSEILATKQFGGAAIISGGAGNIISGGAGNIISGGAGN
ncbi:MAG: hypothetical protein JWO69_597 [Thermoleophilia bacterium]|nr:hypothetical protein [Thermoleophilia bacterium]